MVEESGHLVGGENATESLEGAGELFHLNSSEAIKVEMLEDAVGSLTFIIGAVSALTNLLKNDVFELGNAARVNISDASGKTPGLDNGVAEVGLALGGEDHGSAGVVLDESLLGDHAVFSGEGSHAGNEIVVDVFGELFTSNNAGVALGLVSGLEVGKGEAGGSSGEEVPGALDDGEAAIAHVRLHIFVSYTREILP